MATQERIHWTHDFDAALKTAGERQTDILVDFTAAPM